MNQLADLRENYTKGWLDASGVAPAPIVQFQRWFDEALHSQLPEPNAMHLATVGTDGRPSGRIVLLKGLDERGFVFYTNYLSRKGTHLAHNTQAALTFFWVELERQVRIEGIIEKVSDSESDVYFSSRPRSSQVGAWASAQSQPVASRVELEETERAFADRFAGNTIPRPPHWGGYRLQPDYLEFWQGRPSRLHDRIAYTRQPDGNTWRIGRLSP